MRMTHFFFYETDVKIIFLGLRVHVRGGAMPAASLTECATMFFYFFQKPVVRNDYVCRSTRSNILIVRRRCLKFMFKVCSWAR